MRRGESPRNMSQLQPCLMLLLLQGRDNKEGEGTYPGRRELRDAVLGVGGTVCGRPLAHTPAPLSTLLTFLTLGSPPPPVPLPSS